MATIRRCSTASTQTPHSLRRQHERRNVAAYVAQPNINGGLVGGASLDPDGFATARCADTPQMKYRPVVLAVLDGWGCRDATHGNADRSRRAAALARPLRALSADDARGVRRSRRPSERHHGQQRGRPHESRQRTRRPAGRDAHRRRDRDGRVRDERNAARSASRTSRAPAERCISWGCSPTAACTVRSSISSR